MANTKTKSKSNQKSKTKTKTGSAKKSGPKSKSKNKKNKLSFYESHRNVLMLVYLFVAAFMLCVSFIPGYNFWLKIRGACYGFFGVGFVVFAFCNLIIGIRIAVNGLKRKLSVVTVSGFMLSCVFSSLVHLFSNSISAGGKEEWLMQLKNAASLGWDISYEFNPTGGVLGAFLGGGLLHLLGKTAAFIILIPLLAVFVMLFFDISFSSFGSLVSSLINGGKDKLDGGKEVIKQKSREKHEEHKVKAEIKKKEREERKLLEQQERLRLKQEESDDFNFDSSEVDNDFDNRNIEPERPAPPRVYKPAERLFTDYDDSAKNNPNARVFERPERVRRPDISYDETVREIDTDKISSPVFPEEVEPLDSEADETEGSYYDEEYSDGELSDSAKRLVDDAINSAHENEQKNKSEVEAYSDRPVLKREYSLPPIDCLREPDFSRDDDFALEMKTTAKKLVDTLKSFNVETTLIGVSRGPSVTRYELQPAPGVKISKITNLADDIALNLASSGVRIEAPIPNKSAVGIEVPNKTRATVTLREIISSSAFVKAKSKLNVALGKDISGTVVCTDLAKMPHLLIAGTTGSGKSVCLNCMIASILYNAKPSEVKLLMIDPKQVEFSVYNGIPHLLVPVISDVRKAAGALSWAVGEMESRYKTFSACGVRDIGGFNNYVKDHPEHEPMPKIAIFIDELNDLMMVSPKEVEDSICRLAQKARAAGMHLVVATQRPSVDVITGIIKANIPSRLSLSVSSQVDSRTILDTIGAEKLLGNGDMLFNPLGMSKPTRIQGAYLSEEEIEKIVDFIKAEETAEYDDDVMEEIERKAVEDKKSTAAAAAGESADSGDDMLEKALEVAVECEAASASLFQRKLRIGYARAARIMDQLDERGLIGPAETGGKPRKVLMTKSQFLEMKASRGEPTVQEDNSADDFDVLSD
ncbi:MAG: DNA translocase FtsK [Acutalibacteraceae bacterium]